MSLTISPANQYLRDKITNDECVVLDGAIATELQHQNARDFRLSDSDHWGFEALASAPRAVLKVHQSYVDVGCDVITTNTYGILDAPASAGNPLIHSANPPHWMDMARKSILLAREAIEASGKTDECAIAFSIGGDIISDNHFRTVELLLRAFSDTAPDLVLFETLLMKDDNRTEPAIRLLLDSGLPVWVSFRRNRQGVVGIHGQLWGGPEGDYFGRLAGKLEALGVSALLINCLPTNRVSGTLPWLRDFTDLPLGVYPNLGSYMDPQWRFDDAVNPGDFANMSLEWRGEGAQLLGGCCGVGPEHIAATIKAVKGTPSGTAVAARKMSALRAAESTKAVQPWKDGSGRVMYPLPLPDIHCDSGVFVPTQGSYLMWKHLFNENVGKGKRCLDVGCGAGLLAIQLALNGAKVVTALDIDKDSVANTLTNAFRNGVDKRVIGETANLYYFEPKEKYDIVVASLYQMPTDPAGNLSGHRPIDYWGRNLLDQFITMLPNLLEADGVAYVLQVSVLSQQETERMLIENGLKSRVLDFNPYQFNAVFQENLEQIERVEKASDAYHFTFQDNHVMVMYLLEVARA